MVEVMEGEWQRGCVSDDAFVVDHRDRCASRRGRDGAIGTRPCVRVDQARARIQSLGVWAPNDGVAANVARVRRNATAINDGLGRVWERIFEFGAVTYR